MSVWTRRLMNNEYALAAVSFRVDGRPQRCHFTLEQIGFLDVGKTGGYSCTDVFDKEHKSVTYNMKETIVLYVNPNGIIMFRCYPMKLIKPSFTDSFEHQIF
jgi:hypothetical protein